MKKRKGLYKVLSVVLALSLVLPILPSRVIRAATEFEGLGVTGTGITVTPAAITVMSVENTTLNLMDGIITVTDQTYVQKAVDGTVTSEGEIVGELVLIGNQANGWNITLNGANIPIIRYKNATTNGSIIGTATGIMNIIIEGNCNISNTLFYNLTNISEINVTGVQGNLYTGVSSNIVTMQGSVNNSSVNLDGINFKTNGYQILITVNKNITVTNCTSIGSDIISIRNQAYIGNTYNAIIKNCEFSHLYIYFGSNILFDNVTVTEGTNTGGSFQANYATNCDVIIKNSDLKFVNYVLGGSLCKIINSKVEVTLYSFIAVAAQTVYIEGATLISTVDNIDFQINSSNAVSLVDNSIIFRGDPTIYKRFYNSNTSVKARFDPLDNMGNRLYLNKVKVPGASNAIVTASIDGRTPVNMWTDTDGFLHLYLPTGEHSIEVTDSNNIIYTKNFTGSLVREDSSNPNIIGELEPVKESTNILTPYLDSAIQFSFDDIHWSTATTDLGGYFSVVMPENANRMYIKLNGSGEVRHGVIINGTVSEFYEEKPIITEQSSPEITFLKGMQGTIYVTAVPYTIGNTLNYQWYKNGSVLLGKIAPVFNIIESQLTDAGIYTCVITESDGRTITSDPVTITISETQEEEEGNLLIQSQSFDKTLIKGYYTELYVQAKPSRSNKVLTYQWYKDGIELTKATESKLLLNTVILSDSGSYICRVYEDAEYIESTPIFVTVENNPLEDDLADLNLIVGDLTMQVNNLTQQLETAMDEKTVLQGTINGLENQITILTNQITDLQELISDLEQDLQDTKGDKEQLNQTILTLNNQMLTLNDMVSNLQGQLEAVTLERNILQTTVNMLNNQVLDLINQITLLESRLFDSEVENAELRNQVIELQNIISKLQTDGETLENELEDLLNNNTNLQEQLNTANGTIYTLNALISLIKAELGVIGEDEIIPAIQQLKAQLAQELLHNGLLQEQITNLNWELTHAKDSNTTLLSKLEELYLLVGEEDIDGIKVKIIELQTNLVKEETRIVELEQERNQLLKDLDDAKEQNHSLQEKIDELLGLSNPDIDELKKQILTLTRQINEMIILNNELKESVINLNNQVIEMNAEKAVLESEIMRLQTLLEFANSTIEELREQLGDLAVDKSILAQENIALKAEIEKLKQQLQSGNSSTGNGNTVVDNSKEIKNLQDSLDQAFLELETVKKDLEQAKQELEETTSNDETDNKDNMVIKIPDNSVVVLPFDKTVEAIIKEGTNKPITMGKIIAEEGWEIAPTLEAQWAKEIDLVEVVGQSNKEEVVEYSFYAREEDKPNQVYNQTVDVIIPVSTPNFTMDKLIYLGSSFNLNLVHVAENAKVAYQSADSSIAKINKTGTITPIKAGKTQITGTATKDGIPYQFTVNVTVKDGDNKTLNLKEQAIQTSTSEPVLMVYKLVNKGKTAKVNLEGYANNAIVTYISSDASIATVNQEGIIKGIKKGNTTITAILTQNNTIYTYIIKVRVDDGTVDNSMWDYLY